MPSQWAVLLLKDLKGRLFVLNVSKGSNNEVSARQITLNTQFISVASTLGPK